MTSYHEQLKEAISLSKRTGQHIRKTFSKDEFLKEFPQAKNDPRMSLMTPDHFILDVAPLEGISVLELNQMCDKKGNHPLAMLKKASVMGLADTEVVYIMREELDLLRSDSNVFTASGSMAPTPPTTPSSESVADSSAVSSPEKTRRQKT